MSEDPLLGGWGLRPVELSDQATLAPYLQSVRLPLSDYTFSQIYTWRNSLRLLWTVIRGRLCVFANGTGDLTLLLPPIGDGGTGADAALAEAFDLMNEYNQAHAGTIERSRVEYVSEGMLAQLDASKLTVEPMGADYVYDVQRMIDLAGGDLASKRQARNRFMRNYLYRVETYDPQRHLEDCRLLLRQWKSHQDVQHIGESGTCATKRQKESMATNLSLQYAKELGLTGMVVYVTDDRGESVRGFTFGEPLGSDQSSIVIEKTDLAVKGLAQFIFSEFCRAHWSGRPLVNAGDDWGLESLAWTKMSYRPVKMLKKFVVRKPAGVACGFAGGGLQVRSARADDIPAIASLESACFNTYVLGAKRLRNLLDKGAILMVADEAGHILGESIGLVHRRRSGIIGRIYTLAVHPDRRGQKIGHRLLSAMIERVRARGVDRIVLEVEQSNASAIRLYDQLGFRAVATLPDYYGPSRPGLQMRLDVSSPALLVPAA